MKWEACHKAPYMVNNNKWVSFDNERSVRMKADLAWDKQLAGVMVWSIETDDFHGKIFIVHCSGPFANLQFSLALDDCQHALVCDVL